VSIAHTPARLAISEIDDNEIEAVVTLWQRCGLTRPWNDPHADIALARRGDNAAVLVGREDGAPVASVMVGHDGHRGWVYYVAVDPERQKKGYGRLMMAAAEEWLRAAGIAKLQLLVRRENARANAFYNSLGFAQSTSVMFAKWLDGRDPTP
jgi:ribosomal protein S18 acetylase RimI-like enzyme